MLFGKIIGVNYTSLAWSPYGDNRMNLRNLLAHHILSDERLMEFHDIRVEEIKFLIRKLQSSSASVVNVKSAFREFTLDVMMRMIAGKRYFGGDNLEMEEEGKQLLEILDETSVLAGPLNVGDYLPVLSWFGVNGGLEKKLIALQEKRDVFFERLIDFQRVENTGPHRNSETTMIQFLLGRQSDETIPPTIYTDDMLRSLMLDLLAAGSFTWVETMEWAMTLLLNHPHILKNAQDEIDRVVGNNRLVDESDLANLPYLRAIINETLRMYPAFPLQGPYESSNDCVIAGYNIPRGTMLLVNQWAIHHDPKLWTDPEKFSPERFYGQYLKLNESRLMSFGFGERRCLGEGFGVRMLVMTLGSIIQCFEWERTSEELVDMTEGPGITMGKFDPLVAKCKQRSRMTNLISGF